MIPNQSPARGSVRPGSGGERVGSGVAIGAVDSGEGGAGGRVHGVVGVLPIGLVAAGTCAIGGSDLQVVIAVGVALGALQRGNCVFASEREAGGGVVENRVGPVGGVMAGGTLRHREPSGNVIGDIPAQSLCAVPLRQMAGRISAVGGLNGEVVIVVDVTLRAGSCGVSAGECESGDGMIEGVIGPGDGVVAGGTVCSRECRTSR